MFRQTAQHDVHATLRRLNSIGGGSLPRVKAPVAALLLVVASASASRAIDIVAIEEHWELQVGGPVVDNSSPQVCMVMSPSGDLAGDFFLFTLNHRSAPDYASGGLQVQQWVGETLIDSADSSQTDELNQSDEVITWVQRMEIQGSSVTFEIISGSSTSWGQFGGQGLLKLSTSTNLTRLNGYTPSVSLTESGVSFGGNRVRSLVLTKIRWFDSDGNAYELNAPIDVDADLDP